MLRITVLEDELFDEATNEFVPVEFGTLDLEHSLVSLSKWESTWEIPFLGVTPKTAEQTLDYIRCMTLNTVSEETYSKLSEKNLKEINTYIDRKMTATTFHNIQKKSGPAEVITAELVYYWMVALTIPFECQHWHLNRLLTLVKVCNEKNAPKKKMGKAEMLAQRNALNAQRKANLKTNG